MKLYKTTIKSGSLGETRTSAWQGSQAEASSYRAKAVSAGAKRVDVTTEPIDIPTGKEGLLVWLNANT